MNISKIDKLRIILPQFNGTFTSNDISNCYGAPRKVWINAFKILYKNGEVKTASIVGNTSRYYWVLNKNYVKQEIQN